MTRSAIFFGLAALIGSIYACGSTEERSGYGDPDDSKDDGGAGTFEPDDPGTIKPGCTGLECDVVDCGTSTPTTLTGTVYAPTPEEFGDADPIYNAIVYIPNAKLKPFPAEVTCDKCGAVTSGDPIVTALSASDGTFKLENVPAGDDIPLVIQVGRWRRQVTLPHVEGCKTTKLHAEQTRLPRNKKEGDIPQMAIVTSSFDPTECILRKIGIDVNEFTTPSDDGRVHIYKGGGATLASGTPPAAAELWADVDNLKRYDLIALPCQTSTSFKPTGAGLDNVVSYANLGGRVFITDLSHDVIGNASEWSDTASFSGSFVNPARIDTGFPKGKALADWLVAVGATPKPGELNLANVTSAIDTLGPMSQRWIYSSAKGIETYSFNTPHDAAEDKQCGRVAYSGFHIATSAGASFPSECNKTPLTAQEKTLEFMLFDLASCIQKDDEEPKAPQPK